MSTNQNQQNNRVIANQQGLVSIIVVVILMIIISVITLSFSRVVRDNQRQTLDRQLNTQAYYAAESGVNYANKIIEDKINSGLPIASLVKPRCGPDNTPTGSPGTNYLDNLSLDPGVTVSCLLVETNPKSLVYDLDTTQQSKVFPVKPVSGINRVLVEWTPQNGEDFNQCPSNAANAARLENASSWDCAYAVLRVDLTNTSTGLSRQALAENTFSDTFMPTRNLGGSGSVNFAGKNAFGGNSGYQGARAPATCDASKCSMIINLGATTTNEFYMRAAPIYWSTKMTVKGLDASGNPVSLKDAQIVVDATGKAQDVLRRIQVRVPLVNDGLHGDFGIQSRESICKAFTVFDATYSNNSSCP